MFVLLHGLYHSAVSNSRENMSGYKRNGYNVVFDSHYIGRSGKPYRDGCVYEHILVMERHLGRKLKVGEVVHHKDGNRSNNDISNLELTTASEHSKKHAEQNGFVVGRSCSCCGDPIKKNKTGFCSKCWNVKRRKVSRPTKDECLLLSSKFMNTEIARMYGVTDQAVRKWFKAYGIEEEVKRIRKNGNVWSKKCKEHFKRM